MISYNHQKIKKSKSLFSKAINWLKSSNYGFLQALGLWLSKQFEGSSSSAKAAEKTHRSSSLLNENIQRFDRSKLRKPMVYFMSRVNENKYLSNKTILSILPKTHGCVVIGTPGSAQKRGFGQVYHCGQLRMYSSFYVTAPLIKAALASTVLSSANKVALEKLKGKQFATVEYFLRNLYEIEAENNKLDITDKEVKKEILYRVINTSDEEIRIWVDLNKKINKGDTIILPRKLNRETNQRDREAFEKSNSDRVVKAYPKIDPMDLREVFQQQQLFARYLEQKAGVGESTDLDKKLDQWREQHSIPFLVRHSYLCNANDIFSANCNKSAATLLQTAENLTAFRKHRFVETVTGASVWAVGSSQRMFLWDPLKTSLHRMVNELIGKKHLGQRENEKQELANNKYSILRIVSDFPMAKKIKVLQEILSPTSVLGQIFYTQRTGTWFAPNQKRGALKQASLMLVACQLESRISSSIGIEMVSLSRS